MPTFAWRCDICQSHFPTEGAARACETEHSSTIAGLSIRGAAFKCADGLYGPALGMARMVPCSITVNFSGSSLKNEFAFATYLLERIGPKGL